MNPYLGENTARWSKWKYERGENENELMIHYNLL